MLVPLPIQYTFQQQFQCQFFIMWMQKSSSLINDTSPFEIEISREVTKGAYQFVSTCELTEA